MQKVPGSNPVVPPYVKSVKSYFLHSVPIAFIQINRVLACNKTWRSNRDNSYRSHPKDLSFTPERGVRIGTGSPDPYRKFELVRIRTRVRIRTGSPILERRTNSFLLVGLESSRTNSFLLVGLESSRTF
ncbi:hypothetical protein AVEN_226332-1 [Araneus ventricosus]|uniref:Uncharacterized protein n=1 Tax=Araneus ventricosus TaxID=182803 RepID=A0A4Y2DGZ7_ARAVE|nr:hypothetical protein AVEN_226332-1 [Araneus ventricosus]